ncbi:MAG: HNH endonuclease [Gammaproteobacteria bacterium]|nr:MAG: HNH endonuclease [Gammaproteobacteria bacterium]
MKKSNPADIIASACEALSLAGKDAARSIIATKYPHQEVSNAGRKYTELQSTEIFIRDGFIDRFSGEKLIFPPVLRLLSREIPEEFPFHQNWKMSECHIAYWKLFPTVDHLIPVARGGPDEASNWVTTSMVLNSAKSNWLVEELNWTLHSPGKSSSWDGLLPWYLAYANAHQEILENSYLKRWYKAAIRAKNP